MPAEAAVLVLGRFEGDAAADRPLKPLHEPALETESVEQHRGN